MSDTPTPSFETALKELEEVLRDLEDGSMSLDASLARYEQGVHLLRTCYEKLQKAEQKVQLLAGIDDDGKPILKPFSQPSSQKSE